MWWTLEYPFEKARVENTAEKGLRECGWPEKVLEPRVALKGS